MALGFCLAAAAAWFFAENAPKAREEVAPRKPLQDEHRPMVKSGLGEAAPGKTGPAVTGVVFVDGYMQGRPFTGIEDIPGDPNKKYYLVAQKYFKWFTKGDPAGEELVNVPASPNDVMVGQPEHGELVADPVEDHTRLVYRFNLLNTILPAVQFENATVTEALEFLRQQSVRLDPKGEGVSFVLHCEEPQQPAEMKGELAFVCATETEAYKLEQKRISCRLSNIPLGEALKYMTDLAGLTYKVAEDGIIIKPAGTATDDTPKLYTMVFDVREDFLEYECKQIAETRNEPCTAKTVLLSKGILFDVPGSTATMLNDRPKVVVRHTRQYLDLISTMIGHSCDPLPGYLLDINARILPSVQFQDAPVTDVIAFFQREAASVGDQPPAAYTLVPFGDDPSPPERRVSFSLSKVPLGIAIQYFADLAGLHLWYQGPETSPEIQFRE
jgi:hypothetical protein